MQTEMQVAQGISTSDGEVRPELFGSIMVIVTTQLERLQVEELFSLEMLEMAKARAMKRAIDEGIVLKPSESEVCTANNEMLADSAKKVTQNATLVMACDVQPLTDLRKIAEVKSAEERKAKFDALQQKHGIGPFGGGQDPRAAIMAGLLHALIEGTKDRRVEMIPINTNEKDPTKLN